MSLIPIIIQLISGGIGGNIAGALLKKSNPGPIGNSMAGTVGGVGRGQLLSLLTGAVVMIIVGLIKAQMAKSS